MCQLQYSRISQDWLDAMSWYNNNTNMFNASIQQQCVANYGYTCRVISWWDYGHWTTFLGNTQSVLDPFNHYEFMDQEVANDFVGSNETNLVNSMLYFHASHVEVDFELIQKWGALVYLAGTCTYNNTVAGGVAVGCPNQLRITNWQVGAGQSVYEYLHYPEYLQVIGQCPLSPTMYALKSNFGNPNTQYDYCMNQNELVPVVNNNLDLAEAKPLVIVNLLTPINNLNNNTAYLLQIQRGVFVNANPQVQSSFGSNKFFDSMFARLYFFSNLPGFNLAYQSPNGEVKIFSFNYTEYKNYENSISTNVNSSIPITPLNSSANPALNYSINSTLTGLNSSTNRTNSSNST
jgi:asparagine N-glycosylation enzyme membrane subunit Stt3